MWLSRACDQETLMWLCWVQMLWGDAASAARGARRYSDYSPGAAVWPAVRVDHLTSASLSTAASARASDRPSRRADRRQHEHNDRPALHLPPHSPTPYQTSVQIVCLFQVFIHTYLHIFVSCTRLQSVNWILMHLLIYWLIDGVISRVSISFVAYMIIMNIWYRVINTLLSVDFHGFTLTSQANQSCLSCLNKLETITNKLLELNILQRLFTDLLTKASTSK